MIVMTIMMIMMIIKSNTKIYRILYDIFFAILVGLHIVLARLVHDFGCDIMTS